MTGIESDDIADSGPAKGHRFGCHRFECDGNGGILPGDYCTCDYAERIQTPPATDRSTTT